MINRLKNISPSSYLWMAAVVLLAGIPHAFNMAQYPAFFDDEGTYVSQAMSVLYQGRLAPYTYWYDHAPLGWMLMALWGFVTGGFFSFGSALVSGRILMLLLHVVSAILLFKIVVKLTRSRSLGLLAVVPFALSPLAITMHRMVFLDNILMPFLLGAILLLINQQRLSRIMYSGALLAMAILIKLSMIYFLPALALMVFFAVSRQQRAMGVAGWLAVTGSLLALFPLYAIINNELFPMGTWLGGDAEHVSLIETAQWQATRPGGFFLDENSAFQGNLRDWLRVDSVYLIFGLIATLITTLWGAVSQRARAQFFIGLLTLSYCYYLIRGGVVNTQYVIPLFPLFSIHIAALFGNLANIPLGSRGLKTALATAVISALLITGYVQNTAPYTTDYTTNQLAAIDWIRGEVAKGKVVIVDAYALPDLMDVNELNIYQDKGAQHYWKVDFDPALGVSIFENDWSNIDYVMSTDKLAFDVNTRREEFVITQGAFDNSQIVARFGNINDVLDVPEAPIANMGDVVVYQVSGAATSK